VSALGLALLALSAVRCGSGNDCKFELQDQAVSPDGTPWVCTAPDAPRIDIVFRFDGTGTSSLGGDFQWTSTNCRSAFLRPTSGEGVAVNLMQLGGDVEVGRLVFELDGVHYLCGFGQAID
jgi:hypothetical protein